MTTLQTVELGVLGPLQVRQYGLPVAIPGAKPRALLTMLGLHAGSVVSADTLLDLLWGDDPPRTAAKALQTHISSLRRTLGDGFVLTEGTGWTLTTTEIDASRYKSAAKMGREAIASGDTSQAVARLDEALALWRGVPELPEGSRGTSEKTRWIEGHAALVEDRADALLATGRAAEIIGELEAAVGDAPLRERRWGQLMLALYRAGRQGEALGAFQRARSLLADELGVDPGPDLRRLEAAIVAQDDALETPVSQQLSSVTRAVTFLLTDIEGSTAAWEAQADAMAMALARHDEIVEQVVTSRGGRLIKTRGEGDATFSVFDRPSAASAAAIELQEAILHEPWEMLEPLRIRVALHTGEVELRDGDYFGRAVNRAARLRSLAAGGQILCSGATAELVIDTLPDDVVLADLGMRQLKNLPRPEHVFELRLENADDFRAPATEVPIERPGLPAVLAGPGPFVGRGPELARLLSAWQTTLAAGTRAVLIAGEPGVGKTRLAGEWSRQAYEQGALVLYGRCDEDLGAPYQPFAEALRTLVPCLDTKRLRGLRGVEALLPLVPGLADALTDLAAPSRADPDTERYALFDAVVAMLGVASASAPVVLILDDLHWAAKPTLLLLRHLLRFGEHARVQIVGTYRSTDLDRSHPLAAMLADLHRDGSASRIALSGLDEGDVTTYVAEAGYDDEELARALAIVTGGNPFFLIEALRHVDESGGRWDPSTLPQGVREAVSRRLSRLPTETNKALAAAAVVGSHFALALVESVVGDDLVDAFDEASKAGIVIEEPGGRYRFNHAIVRQSLLAELASVRRMRLHQKIAATLETQPGADDELLAELAYHYFECAWAGNAAKAVEYCRRAADQAMARLAYEGAADLYDRAWHALEEIDDELPDRDDQQAELLVARCEALLAAGDVVSATGAVSQLQEAARDSGRLAAWGTCFDGQLSMLTDPERLDEIESALRAAAAKLAGLDDAAGEAKAHTVRAGCLARLGRIGDAETALDQALTAARRAGEHRRVNAVLAGAPLAALWGPNPVPRAGGRCLDVVRLLRITTGSPVVEATSTRCQGVLDAFRGRAAAGRALIDSARRTLTELGVRHALLEVDQFAGIVELVADDPTAAEPHLRRAYNGFRRMCLDVDTAETAALLARACLALDRDAEADELCTESERLAGHALKASIAWRTVRAQLFARSGAHEDARRIAEEAVTVAERTDGLVDHGDACLALATVLRAAGDTAGARVAAEQAVELYELKGAAALAEKARSLLGGHTAPAALIATEPPRVELDNACVRVADKMVSAVEREAWDEVEQLLAPKVFVESRRKVVGFARIDLPSRNWPREMTRYLETGFVLLRHDFVAVRGERLALVRLEIGTKDASPGAPRDDYFQLVGLDEEGRIALQVWFDIDDMDAAVAELDATHTGFEGRQLRPLLENAASRADARFNTLFADRRFDEIGALFVEDVRLDDRRLGLRRESTDRETAVADIRTLAEVGATNMTSAVIAIRGERLALVQTRYSGRDQRPEEFRTDLLRIAEVDADGQTVAYVAFDPDDFAAAFEELDARYLVGEAAPYARIWQSAIDTLGEANRHEPGPIITGLTYVDHRRVSFGSGNFGRAVEELWALVPDARYRVTAVHSLDAHGTVASLVIEGTDSHGNELEWSRVVSLLPDEPRMDVYEEDDVDTALARFRGLRSQARLENAASRVDERSWRYFAAREWAAVAEILTEDFSLDDRRQAVNAGIRPGRDAEIRNVKIIADLGAVNATSNAIATRGERLALCRLRFSDGDQGPEAFTTALLAVVEIDADNRIAARTTFDLDDMDAAIEELDARYLTGEAAAHAHTWSVISRTAAAFNRQEIPAATPNSVNIDHRRATGFAPGELTAYMRATWDLTPQSSTYIETVHQLTDFGAVVTFGAHSISQVGFTAEWRVINLFTVVGNLISRCELFDEVDLDAALAQFEQLSSPAPQLENAASQADDRFFASFAARDWDAMAEILADDFSIDDRRRVVNIGIRNGRDVEIANMRATAEIGSKAMTSVIIATRGKRLALSRIRAWGRDQRPEAFHTDALGIVEINADNRIAARVAFDVDDIDAAIAELDARYLAGEAAAHANTWSVITRARASLMRHELPQTTTDWVNLDHRRGIAFEPGDLTAFIRDSWHSEHDVTNYIDAVHRLSNLGAVFTQVQRGTSHEGFDGEWRIVEIMTVQGALINRAEFFDEADLDAALAKFEQLTHPAPQLENAAIRVLERYLSHFTSREWDAMAETVADDFSGDDRRRVVNGGVRRGRDSEIANVRAIAEVGCVEITSTPMATRGERLVLARHTFTLADWPEPFDREMIDVVEVNADNKVVAEIAFDADDIDAAFAELDARYLAGEAAAHAHTWSVIMAGQSALNSRERPPLTPDCVNIDHRRGAAFAPGELNAYLQAGIDLDQNIQSYVEAVHRLTDLGAVWTHVAFGVSAEGFEAEWRGTDIVTVDGDLIDRGEIFDESDLDAALARFDELSRPAPRLENAASQVLARVWTCFAARDWAAVAETMADDFTSHDHRRIVNAGVRRGRDVHITNMRAVAEVGFENLGSTVIATRGQRLALSRTRSAVRGRPPEEVDTESIMIVEIDADNRLVDNALFDLDDIGAAFEELDVRYLAGEAAAHAHTWSVVAGAVAAANRHEFPALTPDWVNVDHRRAIAFAPGDMTAYVEAIWDTTPHTTTYVEAVHRLSAVGAVVTQVAGGISQQGFEAEWRMIGLSTVDGDLINRCELFDEADLDVALARFDELSRPVPRLENAASQVHQRFYVNFAARDWAAMTETLAEDVFDDDRRRMVGAGVRHGRDAVVANVRAVADVGITDITSTVVATRGGRLALSRERFSGRDQKSEAFYAEVLGVVEINADDRIVVRVAFDPDDLGAAFEELDARYLAGEAAAHAHTWSLIGGSFAAVNRHELPELTPDWVNIDHRRAVAVGPGDMTAYIQATLDDAPAFRVYIEAVHRLTDLGAVVTQASRATSHQRFDAEWRMISISTVDGDRINRGEIFDETDLDAALAKFDELSRPAPRLENAASRVYQRFWGYFAARDWNALAESFAADISTDDRRRVVNAGVQQGRDAQIADMRSLAGIGAHITAMVMATRGERLLLARVCSLNRDLQHGEFDAEMLSIIEIDTENRIAAGGLFDLDDIDAALEDLDARYLAGEAAEYADTWSVFVESFAAVNRRQMPATTDDYVIIDHQLHNESSGLAPYLHASWDITPDLHMYIEAVHRLNDRGGVITLVLHGTSQEGFDAEWRIVEVLMAEGDVGKRCEVFDESNLDVALARFEELNRPAP